MSDLQPFMFDLRDRPSYRTKCCPSFSPAIEPVPNRWSAWFRLAKLSALILQEEIMGPSPARRLGASCNHTLYNGCADDREPDWTAFHELEINCCATMVGDNGDTWVERTPLHEAEFFTVYGYRDGWRWQAITDVSTHKLAREIAFIFKEKIGQRCAITDWCRVKSGLATEYGEVFYRDSRRWVV